MSSLQAFYAGAFNNVTEVSNLSEVLQAGNVANMDINMNQKDLLNVDSLTNTTSALKITAPVGLSLNGSIGTSGVSVLVSGGAGQPTWVNGISATPTLNQVMVVSSNTTSENITSTANITANQVTINTPLSTAYSTLAYSIPSNLVGSTVSVVENPIGIPLTISSTWQPLLTSATVLPLGVYMMCVSSAINTPIPEGGSFAIGVVNTSGSNVPLVGTEAFYRMAPCSPNFTTFFVSYTGFQSPKFVYNLDTELTTINSLSWTCMKIG
jgi:hypothetical protein